MFLCLQGATLVTPRPHYTRHRPAPPMVVALLFRLILTPYKTPKPPRLWCTLTAHLLTP